jgi:hypothetical protein
MREQGRANRKEKVVGRVTEYLEYCAIWMG